MNIEIIDELIRFRLHGLAASVDNRRYSEVGCRLMDQMWQVVKGASLKTTGINHWVYFADDRLFVGVEVCAAADAAVPLPLEPREFVLPRYARHLHIGPYTALPQKWQSIKAELSARGEFITLPSLEVYGHSCEGDDGSEAETTILMGLRRLT